MRKKQKYNYKKGKSSTRSRGSREQSRRGQRGRFRRQSEKESVEQTLPEKIKIFGQKPGDGKIQINFTLPIPANHYACEAAKQFAQKMGLQNANVVCLEALGNDYSIVVVNAECHIEIDSSEISQSRGNEVGSRWLEIDQYLNQNMDRKVRVVGACLSSNANSAGIDTLFNMKGYMGDWGLESYSSLHAMNLRAQSNTAAFVEKIKKCEADAVIVSCLGVPRDQQREELQNLADLLSQDEKAPDHLIKICSGPDINAEEAQRLGYDTGFAPAAMPSEVARFIAVELTRRLSEVEEDQTDQEDVVV